MNRVKEYFKDYDFLENFRLLKTNIKGDINGGITTAIIALPLALAFGVSSGLGAKAGLIGAIVVGLLASIFGGTPAQISGPTAPMTIIVATVIAQFTNQPIIVFAIIALAGIFQITFGLTKVGKYIQYMPYPVLSGFMSGIGIIIVLSQINPILGLEFTNNIGSIIQSIPHSLMNLNLTSTIIGCTTLILIYSLARMRISFPGAIIAIILATSASKLLHLDVVTIGDIPSGLPSFQRIPLNWNILKIIIAPAMTLAIMGLLDSLLTSLVADRLSEHKHNSNRELIGQGIGNLFSGLLGGLPGAGATIRTEVNIHNGGKTPLSGITYATVIFISMLFLGQWLRDIPMACLAAILFKAGLDIIDFRSLKRIFRIPVFDEVVLLVVLALTISVNIMVAVGIGLLLACILFVKRMGDLLGINVINLNEIRKFWIDDESWRDLLTKEEKDRVLIFQLNGPLFFGASSNFLRAVERHGDFAGLILRMHRVPEIDTTGVYALEELAELFKKEKKFLFITGLGEQPKEFLRKLRVMDLIGEKNCFRRFSEAACHAAKILRAK